MEIERKTMTRERYVELCSLANATIQWLEKQGLQKEELPEFYVVLVKMAEFQKTQKGAGSQKEKGGSDGN